MVVMKAGSIYRERPMSTGLAVGLRILFGGWGNTKLPCLYSEPIMEIAGKIAYFSTISSYNFSP